MLIDMSVLSLTARFNYVCFVRLIKWSFFKNFFSESVRLSSNDSVMCFD